MAATNSALIYFLEVMHRRTEPVRYRFMYRVFSLLLDVDRLSESGKRCRLFSHNRPNLFSFYDADHGPGDGSPLRPWIDEVLQHHHVDLEGGRVMLLAFPRVLGYTFKPLSIWYCLHRDGTPRAVLCEVRNTFGEQHSYLLHDQGAPLSWPVKDRRSKVFHVSPLIPVDGHYRFRLTEPGDTLSVSVQLIQHDRLLLAATQRGNGQSLTDRALLRALFTVPLMTFKVIAAIHWQALKIWLQGTPFHRKPAPPQQEITP